MKCVKPLLVTCALFAAGSANAAITIYTSQAAFLAAVTAPAVDTFEDFSITGTTASPVTRAVGTYGYTASAAQLFFGAGSNADHWLSTNSATNPIVLSLFTGGVKGVGAFFFGSEIDGSFKAGNINLSATDGSGTVNQSVIGATTGSFVGFVTDGAFSQIIVASVQPAVTSLWPTVNDLTLAGVAAAPGIPEPGTWALMIAGFGLVGSAMRRKAFAAA